MREKTAEMRKNIIRESVALFRENGYENTTTRQIADCCNINRGLLSYYFPQKQDILFEIYEDYLTAIVEYVKVYFQDEDAMTMSCLSNLFFYRMIEEDLDSKKILYSILENRELRKIKVTKTVEIYLGMYQREEYIPDYNKLLLSSTLTIGAEAEVILAIRDGIVKMTDTEVAYLITQINFSTMGIPDKVLQEHFQRALEIFGQGDVTEVKNYMDRHIYWYTSK